MLKKKFCFEMRTVTNSNPERDFFSFIKTKKVCRCFASLSSEHFTHGMYITAFIRPSDVTNSNRSCSMKEKMPKFSGAVSPSPSR